MELFVKGIPALFIKKEKLVVVGDLHIGIAERLEKEGVHLPNAAERMALDLVGIVKEKRAEGVAILGDVKESIGYAERDELASIKKFFDIVTKEVGSVRIAKGNHDGNIEKIFSVLGIGVEVKKQILAGDFALLHGNALPSDEAMKKRYIVVAHGHIAIERLGKVEKAWLVANANKKKCGECRGDAKLIVMPAFSSLVTGSLISERSKDYIPLLRRGLFDYESAQIYSIQGKKLGTVASLSRTAIPRQ